MPTAFNVLYLGKLPLMDTTRGNGSTEAASQFNGRTFGAETDPLWEDFRHLTTRPGYTSYTANSPTDTYNNDADPNQNIGSKYEYFRTTADGGQTWTPHAYDVLAVYNNSVITYTDGTTATIQAHIFQDYNGETFWAPQATQNGFQDAMEAKPIRALKLGTLSTATNSGLGANRDAWEYQIPCFTRGVAITVRDGQKPVEDLAVGDLVLTRDNGLQPIRWIGSRRIGGTVLERNPRLCPIRIRAGALGGNTPASDLIVSPQHRILVRSKLAQRMFGIDEVLVAARQLLDVDGVEIARDMPEVEYFHFMFDDHQLVLANGAETESLYAGPGALNAVGPAARDEILALFPELRELESGVPVLPVRPLVEGRTARHLIGRHALTGCELIS